MMGFLFCLYITGIIIVENCAKPSKIYDIERNEMAKMTALIDKNSSLKTETLLLQLKASVSMVKEVVGTATTTL